MKGTFSRALVGLTLVLALGLTVGWAQPSPPPNFYRLQVEVVGQGTVTPDPEGELYGDTYWYSSYDPIDVQLTAAPDTGWVFGHWEIGPGIPPTATTTYTDNPHTVTLSPEEPDWYVKAVFVRLYTITVTADPEAGGTVEGGGTYPEGTQVTVTAYPDPCYEFVGWYEDDTLVSGDASYTFTVNGDRNLVAKFQKITYTVTVSADPADGGTVTGGGDYECGTQVTVTATANECYEFVGWYEGEDLVSDQASYTFTVNGNRDLVAKFQKLVYTLTVDVAPAGGGTVTVSWGDNELTPEVYPADIQIECCTIVQLTAVPSAGYAFQIWSGDVPIGGPETDNPISIHIDGDKQVTANFILAEPPAAPSDLTAEATCDSVQLNWTDNSDNEEGFRIYRSEDGGAFGLLDTVGQDVTTYNDDTVQEGTLYHYRVTAYNAAGESDAASVTVATPLCEQVCWQQGTVQIGAQGSGNDQQNWFGVDPNATNCFDVGLDVAQPAPFQPPYTDLWFELPPDCESQDIYNKDIRSSLPCDGGMIWTMKVGDSGEAAQVTITWNVDEAAFGQCIESMWLTDLTTGELTDMLNQNTYTYDKAENPEIREFKVEVMCAGAAACPVADAGPDQQVHVTSEVQLDGSGSVDATVYYWEFLEKPEDSAAELSDPNIVNPTFIPDLCGDYLLRLWVKNGGCWDHDEVLITAGNQPPIADAGPDRTINAPQLPVEVQLTGAGNDPDDDPIASWHWELLEKPAGSQAALSDPNAQNPTFEADVYGDYVFQLTVDDGMPCNTWSEPDQVTVTVAERPPCALEDDVEAGPVGWTATGLWHITERKSHSPTHSWWFGDEETGTYGPGGFAAPLGAMNVEVQRGSLAPKATGRVQGELTSPPLPVMGGADYTLSFWYWRWVELYTKGSYDRTWVQVRYGNGPWQTVWAKDSRDPSAGEWLEENIDLLVPVGADRLQIRFLFDSVDHLYNNFPGWFVDDIKLCPKEIPPLEITTTCDDLPDGHFERPYGPIQLQATGGVPPYTWTAVGLPTGVNCTPAGEVAGLPTAPEPYNPTKYTPTFTVTDSAGNTADLQCEIWIYPPPECPCDIFNEDFADPEGWTMTGLWHVTPDSGCFQCEDVADTFAYFGQDETCNYVTGGRALGYLISPEIDADSCVEAVVIGFSHFREVESYNGAYDKTFVQVSWDGGPWQTVWYKDSRNDSPECGDVLVGPIPREGTALRIRFGFDSVDKLYNNHRGWAVDDVWVKDANCVPGLGPVMLPLAVEPEAGPREPSFLAVPNPVRDVHTTTFYVRGVEADLIRVEVYDLSGRLVWQGEAPGNELVWHTEGLGGLPLANGVYLYRVYVKAGGDRITSDVLKIVILR